MMQRFFGKTPKPKQPPPTLDDASKNIGTRGDNIDQKIKKLDEELAKFKAQMSKMRDGPAKKAVQQRALRVLKQKKIYEKQRDVLYTQQFNIDQTKFAQENLQDTVTTVAAMKQANTELKTQFKEINVDEIEDVHDDMEEMLDMNNEIQEVMGRQYGVPDEVDEEDLMNELATLEDEVANEEEVPSYLVSAQSAAKSDDNKEKEPEQEQNVDEHGLPKLPARKVEI